MATFEWYDQVETDSRSASFALWQRGGSFAYIGEHVSDGPTTSILTKTHEKFEGRLKGTIEVEDLTVGHDLPSGSNVKLIQYSYGNELHPA